MGEKERLQKKEEEHAMVVENELNELEDLENALADMSDDSGDDVQPMQLEPRLKVKVPEMKRSAKKLRKKRIDKVSKYNERLATRIEKTSTIKARKARLMQ